ncbi:hypothetical protein [uncultured Ruegeria sp.]|uniref:hypothetical protein n=1 Tax=uncultured Ruegeria sp. TaxID=259304 RepID=UPI00261151A7|nr:hypothetical protein [uncultured Ruegeria sp.]
MFFARISSFCRFQLPGSPAPRRLARKARRGSLVVGAALGLVIATLTLTLFWQSEMRKARHDRNLARAQQVAEIASFFDLYVHKHAWWGEIDLGYSLPPKQQTSFEDWMDGVVSPDIAGFDITYIILTLNEQFSYYPDLYGLLLLSANEDPAYADLDGLLDALEAIGLNSGKKEGDLQDRLLSAENRVEQILGRSLGTDEAAILTASLSGVPEDYLLRETRAGHALPELGNEKGVFDLAGNAIIGVNQVSAENATAGNVTGIVEGNNHTGLLTEVTGTLDVDESVTAFSLQVTNALGLGGINVTQAQAGQTTVLHNVAAGTIAAMAGPLEAADMFGETVTTKSDVTGIDAVLASDVLAKGGISTGTADLTTLTAVQANVQKLTVSGSCDGC